MTVLALPELTPELFARHSTLHIIVSSLPVVSPRMLSFYNSPEFWASWKYFRIQLAYYTLNHSVTFIWLVTTTTHPWQTIVYAEQLHH